MSKKNRYVMDWFQKFREDLREMERKLDSVERYYVRKCRVKK